MALVGDSIHPIDLAQIFAGAGNIMQLRQARAAEERQNAFRQAMQNGDMVGAQAADPGLFAKLQQQQLEAQKAGLDIAKTRQDIATNNQNALNERSKNTRAMQERVASALQANPRWAQQAQQAIDTAASRGEIDHFVVPTQTETMADGAIGPADQTTAPQQVEVMQRMASADPTKRTQALTDTATTLRKEFESLPEVKNYSVMRSARANIESASVNGVGALNIVFAYMKALDPNSSVREGEAASARNAGGIPESIRSLYNRALGRDGLTDNLRRDFIAESQKLEANARTSYDRAAENYGRLASKNGIAPEDIVFPYDAMPAPQSSPPQSNTIGTRRIPYTVPAAVPPAQADALADKYGFK